MIPKSRLVPAAKKPQIGHRDRPPFRSPRSSYRIGFFGRHRCRDSDPGRSQGALSGIGRYSTTDPKLADFNKMIAAVEFEGVPRDHDPQGRGLRMEVK